MSAPGSAAAAAHLRAVISRWPKATLRPDCQLRDVLAKRLEQQPGTLDVRQVNALSSLLENRYMTQSPMPTKMLEPKSNPTYYKDLLRELEEAPKRSWFGRIAKRLGGMIRLT
ncbi:hypothetical protein VTJ04DRAFT_10868 [Mycothermus thermophilus]|uniref:uncharacterized protein n=1 Tax=Humicola insolens TaxID=85995 RepID=UPI003743F523